MTRHISYTLHFDKQRKEQFSLDFDEDSMQIIASDSSSPKDWVALSFFKCQHCPLNNDEHPHCSPAMHLQNSVERIGHERSDTKVLLEVKTPERITSNQTTLANAFSSFMGLVIATSDCPYAIYFRPMARFHLPLASTEETAFRAISSYLMGQYFRKRKALDIDEELEGLSTIYANMEKVNHGFAKRLRNSGELVEVNSLVQLDLHSKNMALIIQEAAAEFELLYKGYLQS